MNLVKEKQKGGIGIDSLDDFFYYCTKDLKLNIVGLMAIPPNDEQADIHFKGLMQLNLSLGLRELSMGMSGDFQKAIQYKTTFVRIGSSNFGERSSFTIIFVLVFILLIKSIISLLFIAIHPLVGR